MKKDWKYILYLAIVVGIFVAIRLLSPKQYDWSVTFSHEDKNPFGTYAFHQLLPQIVKAPVKTSYKTLYELRDSIGTYDIIVVLASRFNAEKADVEVLLQKVNNGATAFISANYFSGALADSLGISTYDNLFKDREAFLRDDTASLYLTHPALDSTFRYPYRRDNIHNYFGRIDSVRTAVVARNEIGHPVSVKVPYGKGNLLLNCTPMVFTNIHLLSHANHAFAAGLLSYLPNASLWRTEFYHLGRMEAATPLRFILQNEPLRWAYYIALLSLLAFMIIEVKRKQRIIPIIRPPANSTLEFVTTIGNLYFQKADHKNIAEKKIIFFFEQVRAHYFINTALRDAKFVVALARKSGHSQFDIDKLMNLIETIQHRSEISAEMLTDLNARIEKFWNKH